MKKQNQSSPIINHKCRRIIRYLAFTFFSLACATQAFAFNEIIDEIKAKQSRLTPIQFKEYVKNSMSHVQTVSLVVSSIGTEPIGEGKYKDIADGAVYAGAFKEGYLITCNPYSSKSILNKDIFVDVHLVSRYDSAREINNGQMLKDISIAIIDVKTNKIPIAGDHFDIWALYLGKN